MEEIKELFKEIMLEIKDLKNENRETTVIIKGVVEENIQLRKELEKMKERMEKVERNLEEKEKEEKRNNIVIRGVEIEEAGAEKEVEKMMKDKLNIEIKVKQVEIRNTRNNKKLAIVKIMDYEDKRKVMREKRKLKGTRVYIDDDRTEQEQKIQIIIKKRAIEEKNNGNNVKIGFKKIWINGEEWKWNEKNMEIEKNERKQNQTTKND